MIRPADAAVLIIALAALGIWGFFKARSTRDLAGFLVAGRTVPWPVVAFSVMATQASAVTFMATPGQGYVGGLSFVQFYFGLPIAMVVLCATLVPVFQRLRVHTAYEFLEQRFDGKTRTLALTFVLVLRALPQGMGLPDALVVAGASGRLAAVDTSFDPASRYNLWAGLLGGFFLQLSYFGTDQSQVGRFLTARSARESRLGLLFNGLVKVPMQFFILLLGVLVFVAYRFEPAPVFFNPAEAAKAAAGPHADDWHAAERAWDHSRAELAKALREEHAARKGGDAAAERDAHARGLAADVAANAARVRAVIAISSTDPNANTNDTNYIFLRYVLSHLPVGMVGLVLAAIFAAAMNSSMSELNALASTTVVDVVERLKWASDERELLAWSRFATLFWVVFAVGFAQFAARLGSLVEAVNIMGSLFYGTMLGIFLTALFVKRAGGTAVFTAAILGEAAVIVCWKLTPLSFLWWNLIGCVLTLAIAALLAPVLPARKAA